MNLIAHIVRKDLRRLAAPLGVWLAVVIGKAAALVVYARGSAPWPGDWFGPAFACVNGLEMMLGYLIAVLLVLEDSPTDGRALWHTRPISGAALLGAKLCGAALAFVALPTLLLTPIWLAAGFGFDEIGRAALDWVCVRGALVLVALSMAAVFGGLATAIFSPLALALPIGLGALAGWMPPGGLGGVLILTTGAGGVALAFQYVVRRRAAAILVWTMGAGLAAGGIAGSLKAPSATNAEEWTATEKGLPVAENSSVATADGLCRVFAVKAGSVTRHTEDGVIREVRRPTRIGLREIRPVSALAPRDPGPEPAFRWEAASGEAAEAQARRRGQARAASLQVVDFEAELPPGAEARANWRGWKSKTETQAPK